MDRRGGGGRGGDRDPRDERVNRAFVVDTGPSTFDANVCFEFQRSGKCSKGDACRFSHGGSGAGPGPSAKGGQKDWSKLEAATLRRAADGSLELVDPAPASAAAAAGSKRQRDELEGKESKKDKKRRKKEEKKRKKEEKKRKKEEKNKKKKDKDKKSKKDKRGSGSDSDSDSSSSSSSSSSGGGAGGGGKVKKPSEEELPPGPDVNVVPISEDDYFLKNHEFSSWLRTAHNRFFTDLKADEARALFKDFVEAWNARSLPKKLYAGITVTGRR